MAIISTTIQGDPNGSAAPVTVSSALPAGTNVIGHVIADSGSTTAVTGNVTVVQPTGTNLHTVLDSGTLTSITNALPAGTNVIGHIIADSGSTTVVTGNVTVVQGTGTNLHTVVDSGTVTANIGTTNGLALDATLTGGTQKTKLVDTGGTNVATISAAGALKVDGSAVTQPISGTITVTQATGTNLHTVLDSGTLTSITNALPAGTNVIGHVIADSGSTTAVTGNVTVVQATAANLNATVTGTVSITANSSVNLNQVGGNAVVTGGANGLLAVAGPVASGGANADNPIKEGAVFNTTQPTVTNGQIVDAQATARGAKIVATGVDTFNVTVNAALPAGGNTIGAVTQASGPWTSNITQISGSAIATAATGIAKIGLTDGAGTSVTVGQKAMASSLPVAVASDQAAFPININATTANKTKVMKTGTLVTTAVTADQVVLTYTVTAGKTFYLEYVMMDSYVTTQPGNTNPIYLGAISLETPSGTKVITEDKFHGHNSPDIYHFSDPLPVAAATVIRVVTTPAAATSFTWRANFGGYEA